MRQTFCSAFLASFTLVLFGCTTTQPVADQAKVESREPAAADSVMYRCIGATNGLRFNVIFSGKANAAKICAGNTAEVSCNDMGSDTIVRVIRAATPDKDGNIVFQNAPDMNNKELAFLYVSQAAMNEVLNRQPQLTGWLRFDYRQGNWSSAGSSASCKQGPL